MDTNIGEMTARKRSKDCWMSDLASPCQGVLVEVINDYGAEGRAADDNKKLGGFQLGHSRIRAGQQFEYGVSNMPVMDCGYKELETERTG